MLDVSDDGEEDEDCDLDGEDGEGDGEGEDGDGEGDTEEMMITINTDGEQPELLISDRTEASS